MPARSGPAILPNAGVCAGAAHHGSLAGWLRRRTPWTAASSKPGGATSITSTPAAARSAAASRAAGDWPSAVHSRARPPSAAKVIAATAAGPPAASQLSLGRGLLVAGRQAVHQLHHVQRGEADEQPTALTPARPPRARPRTAPSRRVPQGSSCPDGRPRHRAEGGEPRDLRLQVVGDHVQVGVDAARQLGRLQPDVQRSGPGQPERRLRFGSCQPLPTQDVLEEGHLVGVTPAGYVQAEPAHPAALTGRPVSGRRHDLRRLRDQAEREAGRRAQDEEAVRGLLHQLGTGRLGRLRRRPGLGDVHVQVQPGRARPRVAAPAGSRRRTVARGSRTRRPHRAARTGS